MNPLLGFSFFSAAAASKAVYSFRRRPGLRLRRRGERFDNTRYILEGSCTTCGGDVLQRRR
ncbi:hypothetical protein ERO13_D05G323800v2 [Gossypium hirsutum]|nr:hypothetical protein ERO13_D05G323800v2 [Gossypium hirsutum]